MKIIFAQSNRSNFITDRDSSVKILFPILFFITIIITQNTPEIIFVSILALFLSFVAQGVKSTFQTIWFMKLYFIVFLGFIFIFSDFTIRSNSILLIIKLIAIILAFTTMNQSLSPDQLTNGLIKLKVPSGIAWTIGVAFRQAIFTIDEVDRLTEIQRLRGRYSENTTFGKLKYRVNETINLLTALLGRSVIVSASLTDTLVSRGFTRPHPEIIMNTTNINLVDLIFLLIFGIIPFAIITYY